MNLEQGELSKEQYDNYKKVADEFYAEGELLFEINLDESEEL